jgi:hypothetical protein
MKNKRRFVSNWYFSDTYRTLLKLIFLLFLYIISFQFVPRNHPLIYSMKFKTAVWNVPKNIKLDLDRRRFWSLTLDRIFHKLLDFCTFMIHHDTWYIMIYDTSWYMIHHDTWYIMIHDTSWYMIVFLQHKDLPMSINIPYLILTRKLKKQKLLR